MAAAWGVFLLLQVTSATGPVDTGEHVGYLVACPLAVCWMGAAATGLVGLAYAHAQMPPARTEAMQWVRHVSTAAMVALTAAVGAAAVAYPLGGLFEIPRRASLSQTYLGALAGGMLGTFLVPPGTLMRPEGKVLVLLSASFFASVGAALAYDWPYLRDGYRSGESPPPGVLTLYIPVRGW